MIQLFILEKNGFKTNNSYIVEVKRSIGLPMYDAPNGVEELKNPRKHSTKIVIDAIMDALRYF